MRLEGKERAAVCDQARAYVSFTQTRSPGPIWEAAGRHGTKGRLTRLAFRIATRFQHKG